MKRIYLDYAATTPVDPKAVKAMQPYFSGIFGNPSSLHRCGQEASAAVFKARKTIADAIGAHYSEIVFTGSATEANNLALRGITKALGKSEILNPKSEINSKYQNQKFKNVSNFVLRASNLKPRIIITSIEHESILETAKDLERQGVEVVVIPVSRDGIVDLKKLRAALNERTVLVSVIYANNTIGTIQPIVKISEAIRNFRERRGKREKKREMKIASSLISPHLPLIHTDAVQAFQYLDCNADSLGVDLMTLSAHKIYGPKGIGLFYRRISNSQFPISKQIQNSNPPAGGQNFKRVSNLEFSAKGGSAFGGKVSDFLSPLVTGGGQEFGFRSGTENVPYIVGFAKAVEIAVKMRKQEAARVRVLRDKLLRGIKKIIPKAVVNGSIKTGERLPNNLNIYIPKKKADEFLVKLDLLGIAISAGPACASRAAKPAGALIAIGASEERALSSIRITLGRPTNAREIDSALAAIKMIIARC